ncbi:hypothetical protein K1X76_09075 [bacterium]|nr:hypothetical protein [bacterium]
MLERYCDALVIGTELSGLITAAFLARRGLTVHVLNPNPFHDTENLSDPYPVTNLHSKLLRSILGRLNIPDVDIQALSQKLSPLQLIYPDKRIDISSNPLTYYEELEREFPDDYDNLKPFLEKLSQYKHQIDVQDLYNTAHPQGFMERRRFAKFVKMSTLHYTLNDIDAPSQNSVLGNFLDAQLNLILPHRNNPVFAFQMADLLNPSDGEILSMQGGQNALKKLFIERIQHHEGAYRPDAKIEKLLYKNGIFEGATLAGSDGTILSRYVIWNTQIEKLLPYLPSLFRFRKIRKFAKSLKPKAYWHTCFFEVPTELLPPPMHNNLLILNGTNMIGIDYLYVQLKRKSDFTTIAVNYLLDKSQMEADFEFFNELHDNIMKKLWDLIPFSESKLNLTFPLMSKKEDEDTLFPMKENDFEIFKQQALMHPVFETNHKNFTDLFPLDYKTPSPNFLLTAPEILGHFGFEAKFMLGLNVTDLIWADVEKEKKRAMKLEQRIA